MRKIVVAAGLLVGSQAFGAILAVDFQLTTATTQSGFSAFGVANPSGVASITNNYSAAGVTSGQIGVTLYGASTALGGRERTAITTGTQPAFTYHSLLRDLVTQVLEGSTGQTAIRLTGLDANTQYDVQIWSNDRGFNDNSIYSWYATNSGSSVLLGTITNKLAASASYPDNNAYSMVARVTSNAAGEIKLGHVDSMGTGTLNGLMISAVPEPGSAVMLGGLVLVGMRRRRG